MLITAKVKIGSSAAVNSSLTRLVTVTSVGDGATVDAVKIVTKQA